MMSMFQLKSFEGETSYIALDKIVAIDLYDSEGYATMVDGSVYKLTFDDAERIVALQDRVFSSEV